MFKKLRLGQLLLAILGLATFIFSLIINSLANLLPINGYQTGQISDFYDNLFTPSGFTFSIWGVIYTLSLGFAIYLIYLSFIKLKKEEVIFLKQLSALFSLISVFNSLWIFAWHFLFIQASVIIMMTLLACLIASNLLISNNLQKTRFKKNFLIKTPLSVYFGWITVALIANITAYLVSIGFDPNPFSKNQVTNIVLLIGLLIGVFTGIYLKRVSYLLVLIWAYYGILIRHSSPADLNGIYPDIISTLLICIIVFAGGILYVLFKKRELS
jgi:hypothetical protein